MNAVSIRIDRPDFSLAGIARLEAIWRSVEARAEASFFQSWTWIGCRIAERFDAPAVVTAHSGGTIVGIALFNERGIMLAPRALRLHESGDPSRDAVFVEHNGPLVARGHEAAARAIVAAALAEAGTVVLSGVTRDLIEGPGVVRVRAERRAPALSLVADWRDRLGASTRAQLRRSERRLAAAGYLAWRRAEGLAETAGALDGLVALHARRWRARGQPGAFGEPAVRRFIDGLLERGVPRGEVSTGTLVLDDRPIAALLEFRWRGSVLAYQSGIDPEFDGLASPGLVAHARAIDEAVARGDARYDFLAGDARYKRSLSDHDTTMVWAEVARPLTLRGMLLRGAALRDRWRTTPT